jgi:glutamate 5-kinase
MAVLSSPNERTDRTAIVSAASRVVIKLGTAVMISEGGGVALSRFYSFIEAIATLRKSGREVLLVSSGAVGLGAERLALSTGPVSLPLKQACAAVGQSRLMSLYSDAFDRLGLTAAQLLLTEEDFSNRTRYLNLRSTITNLLRLGVVPVINENDTVSTAELEPDSPATYRKINFGDNDKLSALVSGKMEADLLLILTDVDGLYNADPDSDDAAELISVVEEVTPEIESLAHQPGSPAAQMAGVASANRNSQVGRGGIKTKIEAARIATHSGCAAIVANGRLPSIIDRVMRGEDLGTLFLPRTGLSGKRRWIAFATSINAAVVVNEGARRALVERKASLLSAGVVQVRGEFERGDVVSIVDERDREFARGIANYSSHETRKIMGLHSNKIDDLIQDRNYDALVTRDNLAFLE